MRPGRWCFWASLAAVLLEGGGWGDLPAVGPGSEGTWRLRPELAEVVSEDGLRLAPGKGEVFELAEFAWYERVARAPDEFGDEARKQPLIVELPRPDGSMTRVECVASPVMEWPLAMRYPEVQTYRITGVDNRALRGRMSVTGAGVHARWREGDGWVVVEPLPGSGPALHRVYARSDVLDGPGEWICETVAPPLIAAGYGPPSYGGVLRVYRLAMAATGEWTAAHGGTVKSAMAALAILVNQLNAIYEVELGIRFVLVSDNDRLVYTNAATDPYTGNNANALLDENQATVDRVIGDANYDVGHVLSRASGGLATLSGACRPGLKARGQTGLGNSNDPLFVDYVAHELGHQFGARHTFNGVRGTCGGNRDGSSAYEPGSGSTLMAYAGNCQGDNVQFRSDLYFHAASLDQILQSLTSGPGNGCGARMLDGNQPPWVNAGPTRVIPRGTPFVLAAEGADPDGDGVTFCWEQMDLGPAATLDATDTSQGPLFRSVRPGTNAVRVFPELSTILANQTNLAEKLPWVGRTMRFRVTARDGRGGVAGAETEVWVADGAGPFRVVSPNGGGSASNSLTVTWDVAGTGTAPVNAAWVNVWLSTNNGQSFPHPLALRTPNDGVEVVPLPPIHTTLARVKVEAVEQPFFDVSDGPFTILPPEPTPALEIWSVTVTEESCLPANGAADPGETVTVQLTLRNNVLIPTTNLVVTLLAGNGVVAPGPAQVYGRVAGGQSVSRPFTFTATGPCGGMIRPTWRLEDGGRLLGTVSRGMVLGAVQTQVVTRANTTPLTIPATGTQGPASLFPSTLSVSGMTGRLSRVRVTLTGLSHGFGGDLDVWLVGPQGQAVWLLSDAGNGTNASGTLTFDDAAPGIWPAEGPLRTGTNQPSAYDPESDPQVDPGPSGRMGFRLSDFGGADPNGTWALYLWDDAAGDTGQLTFGWRLELTATQRVCCGWAPALPPVLSQIPDQVTEEDVPLLGLGFTVEDSDTPLEQVRIWAHAADMTLVAPTGIVVSGSGPQRRLDLYPQPDASGSTWVYLVAEDESQAVTNTFLWTIRPVNDAPVLDPLPDPVVHAGMRVLVVLRATDVDTPVERLRFGVTPPVPDGLVLDPVSGRLEWQTSDAWAGRQLEVTLTVTDDGAPPLASNQGLRVTVRPRPQLAVRVSGDGARRLEWGAIPGLRYQVEWKERLDDAEWFPVGMPVTATAERVHVLDSGATNGARFYRVRVVP
ncbi:MAG: reprolysin-like metallopeptidase [Limisphaera sp.]